MPRRNHLMTRGRAAALGAALCLVGGPAHAGESHVVRRGQNLSGIADHYRSSVLAIAARNSIADPNLIVTGTRLRVPTGRWVQRWALRYEPPRPAPVAEASAAPSAEAPAAPTPTAASGSVEDLILDAAAAHGVSGALLLSIARCESGLDPGATNPAGYYGLFQYDRQTWASYGQGSIFDASAQANTTAALIAAGQSDRWPNCA